MDICLTNVPTQIGVQLKDEAKKKNVSCNELIRQVLTSHCANHKLQEQEKDYKEMVTHIGLLIQSNTEAMKNVLEILAERNI